MAAASAPARPHELAGLDFALSAFRAQAAVRPQAAPDPVSHRRPPKRIAAKVIAVLAGVSLVGGVAWASTTGVLPDLFQPGTETTPSASAKPSPLPAPHPSVSLPTEALFGQCQSYLAKPSADRKKELEAKHFDDLVKAAGSSDKVDSYCQSAINGRTPEGNPNGNDPSARPSHPAHPSPTHSKR